MRITDKVISYLFTSKEEGKKKEEKKEELKENLSVCSLKQGSRALAVREFMYIYIYISFSVCGANSSSTEPESGKMYI